MNILQVSASDGGGGAHKIANALHRGFRTRGHGSAMAVGRRVTNDPDSYAIPDGFGPAARVARRVADRAIRSSPLARPLRRQLRRALHSPHPLAYWRARQAGLEYFDYPGSRKILEIPPFPPDIVHCHNLHNEYFDLRSLVSLSRTVPVAMTLHDEWTFTGHCAYGITCERWRLGCGECPDLTIYPSVLKDATRENWAAKQSIYQGARLYVTAPSHWLLDRAKESILAEGAVDFRHIPNGVDQRVFKPGDQLAARALLKLPADRRILLFTANAVGTNRYKDYATVAAAVQQVAVALRDQPLLLVALGGDGPAERVENAELRFVPYEKAPERVAAYYHAADVYLHAANADTFPTTVLEALATGRPVVATAVGGIHEQVRSLEGAPGSWRGATESDRTATGVLVEAHDAEGMAAATTALLRDDDLRARLGANAAADAAARFGLAMQLDATFAWYAESIADWRRWRGLAA